MEVRLFATLRTGRDKVIDMQWSEGGDGFALLRELGLDADDVAIFLINGKHSTFERILTQDDIIAMFPPVGGG